MACTTCKSKLPVDIDVTNEKKILNYIYKFILFLVVVIIVGPFLIPIIIWILFNSIVLSKKLNIIPLMQALGKKLIHKDSDEDTKVDDDEEDFEMEDMVIINKNERINTNKY